MTACLRIVTGTRAEYGLLRPLIERLVAEADFDAGLWVTGMHLAERFGLTVSEIERDGFPIAARLPLDLENDTELGVSLATAQALSGFAEAIDAERPNAIVVLGDRFEVLAAATAAMLARVPVAHIHGGELTLGAVDDSIRHAVTKMSLLHFTSTEEYRRRVIQLGEHPTRVWAVGALGVDNALHLPKLSKRELEADLGPVFGPLTAVVTFHPVTLENRTAGAQMQALLAALDRFEGLHLVFTMPNADPGNRAIFDAIEKYILANRGRAQAFTSLGAQRYLSLVEAADVVIGNSSSGIIEAPSLGTPTVDIGDRQAGRVRAESVLHAEPRVGDIQRAIESALSPEMQKLAASRLNPYGDGHAAERIVDVLKAEASELADLKKGFYDVQVPPEEELR